MKTRMLGAALLACTLAGTASAKLMGDEIWISGLGDPDPLSVVVRRGVEVTLSDGGYIDIGAETIMIRTSTAFPELRFDDIDWRDPQYQIADVRIITNVSEDEFGSGHVRFGSDTVVFSLADLRTPDAWVGVELKPGTFATNPEPGSVALYAVSLLLARRFLRRRR